MVVPQIDTNQGVCLFVDHPEITNVPARLVTDGLQKLGSRGKKIRRLRENDHNGVLGHQALLGPLSV